MRVYASMSSSASKRSSPAPPTGSPRTAFCGVSTSPAIVR